MTGTAIIDALALRSQLPKVKTRRVVRALVALLRESLAAGEPVTIHNLGTFRARRRPSKTVQDFGGERFTIPAGRRPAFTPSRSFKATL